MLRRPLKIPLASIRAMIPQRPPGYYEEVTAAGRVVGEDLWLDQKQFDRLRLKYLEPAADWPIWAVVAAMFRVDTDRGIGDTIKRLVGPPKSERFKRWHEATFGIWTPPCGCGEIAQWNALYIYRRDPIKGPLTTG